MLSNKVSWEEQYRCNGPDNSKSDERAYALALRTEMNIEGEIEHKEHRLTTAFTMAVCSAHIFAPARRDNDQKLYAQRKPTIIGRAVDTCTLDKCAVGC
jgi:acetyltransferase-like isoleucine patch superfamily enzyme